MGDATSQANQDDAGIDEDLELDEQQADQVTGGKSKAKKTDNYADLTFQKGTF
jgi:hypothetical protein